MPFDREHSVAAVLASLARMKTGGANAYAGVEAVERNRVAELSTDMTAGTKKVLILEDGGSGDTADIVLLQNMSRLTGSAMGEATLRIWGVLESAAASVGTDLNAFLDATIKQLATDRTLADALSPNARIVLKEIADPIFTQTERVQGMFGLVIGVGYVLKPTDPASA